MNAERLLRHYERIADAPDAITRLRRFILDLAVLGKLVSQDPKDEPASDLLTRISFEKAQLAKAGEIKRTQEPPPPRGDEKPFSLPRAWAWARFSDVAAIQANLVNPRDYKSYPHIAPDNIESGTGRLLPYDTIGNSGVFSSKHLFEAGCLLYSKIRPALAKVTLVDFVGLCSADMYPLRAFIDRDYLLRFMLADVFVRQSVKEDNRVAMPKINRESLSKILIAVPPLAEQHRIVAKVDELMALCDRLEAARGSREATRDRLTAASLARLNAPDPATFHDDARFALDALPALTTRPDQIKHIRQTIFNLAVRGKLVQQDSNDEPASELLKRTPLLPKPARYDKRSPELIPGDCGLSINNPGTRLPNGWLWVPLVKIARLESGHTPSRNRSDWWGGDVPWIGLVDARLHNNGIITETIQTTNEQGLANSAARLLPKGTVCFSRTASVGYVVIMGRPMATSQDFVNWVPTEAISSSWLQLVMIAERPAIGRFSKGAVHQTIYYPAWLSMHVALPPLAEQHRIVAKLDALIALCDRLEASLTATVATRRRLLDALLAEALAPTPGRTMQAAE